MTTFKGIIPILPANNVKAEIKFFERLGSTNVYDSLQYSDTLDYACMQLEGIQFHIQFQFTEDILLKKAGQQIKIWVEDLEALHKEFKEKGFDIKRRDKIPWGTNEFGFYTPAHNAIIFVQHLVC